MTVVKAEPMRKTIGMERFVGFAFAAAHLLIETDTAGRILFAAGARCGLVAGDVDELVGRSLTDLVPDAERAFADGLLRRLLDRGKLDLVPVTLRAHDGGRLSADLGGCRLPQHPDRCFLAMVFGRRRRAAAGRKRLTEMREFLSDLEARVADAEATGRRQRLSLMQVELGSLEAETEIDTRADFEAYLLSVSSDGDGAVDLGSDRYAVLHGAELAEEEIRRDIARILTTNGADRLIESLRLKTVAVDGHGLASADVARALAYTLQRFARSAGDIPASVDESALDLLRTTVARVSEVRKVLDKREFRLVYQPIVALGTGRVHHYEALMRVGDAPSPFEFIRFAESTGLIGELDLLVCQTALDAMAAVQRSGTTPPGVAVNVSAATLSGDLAVRQLEEVLKPYGDLARHLLIEVTETVAVTDFTRLDGVITRLRGLGLKVCLDDLGAGTTSFTSLNSLRVDFAKLDGALVQGAMTNERDRAVLASIAEIGRHLGIDLIAEQIETEEQAAMLRRMGIRFGQGYYYGRPVVALPTESASAPKPSARRRGEQTTWQ